MILVTASLPFFSNKLNKDFSNSKSIRVQFVSIVYLEAKMFKIEKYLVAMVTWQFFYYFRAAIFKNSFFSRTPLVSVSEDCSNVDYFLKF